jgi:hypothetical protein
MAESPERTERPDWPAELEEPVARLGPPSAVHRIPPRHAWVKAGAGVGFIVFGGAANYAYWVILNGPLIAEHLLFLFLFGPIVSGVGFLYAAWRDRGLWALVYPMGLLRWQRGEVVSFPWNEIEAVAFARVRECGAPRRQLDDNNQLIAAWLPITRGGSRTLGSHLTLARVDGAVAILPSSLSGFDDLCRATQEQTFRVMWPDAWSLFSQGMRVPFGALAISSVGLHRDGDLLTWDQLEDVVIENGKLVIHARRDHGAWAQLPLNGIRNPHVMAALLFVGQTPRVDEEARDVTV